MSKSVALQVLSAPKYGRPAVMLRFLGPPRGILTHYHGKRPEPCPGEGECRQHHLLPKWKGYAPAQYWCVAERVWVPVVAELTLGLVELTGTTDLRGQCWKIYRVGRSYGTKAVEGQFVHQYDVGDLPRPFDVQRTVETLYGTSAILWDVPIDGWTRDRAEVSTDGPPPAGLGHKPAERIQTNFAADHAKRKGPELGHRNGAHKKT